MTPVVWVGLLVLTVLIAVGFIVLWTGDARRARRQASDPERPGNEPGRASRNGGA
jgi:hypothetical protein